MKSPHLRGASDGGPDWRHLPPPPPIPPDLRRDTHDRLDPPREWRAAHALAALIQRAAARLGADSRAFVETCARSILQASGAPGCSLERVAVAVFCLLLSRREVPPLWAVWLDVARYPDALAPRGGAAKRVDQVARLVRRHGSGIDVDHARALWADLRDWCDREEARRQDRRRRFCRHRDAPPPPPA